MKSKTKQVLTDLIVVGIIFGMVFSILPIFVVQAASTANYTGYVRDRNGKAISNAKVTLYSYGTQYSYDYTDSNGFYSFIGVPVLGSPSLKVTKVKWETRSNTVSPAGGTYNYYMYTSACALIVAGSTDEYISHNAHSMYNILIDCYSFKASRVFLLTDSPSYDGITIPRDDDVTQYIVKDACEEIDDLTTANDDVFVFWTSHGIKHDPWFGSTYYTLDCGINEMDRGEFDDALDEINCKRVLVMINSCFSGYFTQDVMRENNRAIFSSCGVTQKSWAFDDFDDGSLGYSYWVWGIIRALDAHSGIADVNYNGRVSVEECMDYTSDYIDSEEPFVSEGKNYYQNPLSYIGLTFGSTSGVYFGDQYY